MTLRRLAAADAPNLRALWREGLSTTPVSFLLTPEELDAIPDATFAANIDAAYVMGAWEHDQLIGFVTGRRGFVSRQRHTADIGPLYVAVKYQRRGHARALMQLLMDQLKTDGVRQCELTLDAENTAADKLYASLGFTPFGRRPRSVLLDGKARTDLLMIRSLDGTDLNAAAPSA